MHVALVPEMGSPGEQKTKPTQHSVKQMRALGEFVAMMVPPALFRAAGASCAIYLPGNVHVVFTYGCVVSKRLLCAWYLLQ